MISPSRVLLVCAAFAISQYSSAGMTSDIVRVDFLETVRAKCMRPTVKGAELSRGKIPLRDGRIIGYVNFQQESDNIVRVYDQNPYSGERIYEFFQKMPKGTRAVVSAKFDRACVPIEGREIEYDSAGQALAILHLGKNLVPTGVREEINPPVPTARGHVGVRVALVDSGVNYLVPEVAQAMARDSQGNILGFDFREMDDRPFDVDPFKHGPFDPVRHGTSVASILLADGKGNLSLIPYSFPGNDPGRFRLLVGDMRRKGVKLANMSMGSADPRTEKAWKEIANAIASAPDVLFVIAAGNEGRNIDLSPSYPASFQLPNVMMVGAVNSSGKVSTNSNYGLNIHVAAIADPVAGRDFNWKEKALYGTSFAAPRITALAAGILQANPQISVPDLKAKICAMAKPVSGERKIACGYFE